MHGSGRDKILNNDQSSIWLGMLLCMSFVVFIQSGSKLQNQIDPSALSLNGKGAEGVSNHSIRDVSDSLSCPLVPSYKLKSRPWLARLAYHLSGGDKQFEKSMTTNANNLYMMPWNGEFQDHPVPIFMPSPEKLRLCVYTTQDSMVNGGDICITGKTRRQTEKRWVNFLLGCFFRGEGPENIYFPPESQPAQYLSDARIFRKALKAYYQQQLSKPDSVWNQTIRFNPVDLITTLPRPLSIPHFTGSASFIIQTLNDSMLLVTVVNFTSLTSADYSTHIKPPRKWPHSIPRTHTGQPMSNICQVYQILIPKD